MLCSVDAASAGGISAKRSGRIDSAALLSCVPSVSQLPVSDAVVVRRKAQALAVLLQFLTGLTRLREDPSAVFPLFNLIKDLCRHSLLLLTLLAAAEVVTET